MRRGLPLLAALALAGATMASCGGSGSTSATTTTISAKPSSRAAEACQLRATAAVRHRGTVTIATATPAYEPWFFGNDPANGLGFESGLAFDLAAKLGFAPSKVRWIAMPFAAILAKGQHPYDLAISEIPGDVAQPASIKLSKPYWADPLALVVLRRSALAKQAWSSSSTSDQGTGPLAEARLGVVRGSSAARYVVATLKPKQPPRRFADLEQAAKALTAGRVDGVLAALPDAWLMARNAKGARLLGTFVGSGSGLVVAAPKAGIPMGCVNAALGALAKDGTTKALAKRYLAIYKR